MIKRSILFLISVLSLIQCSNPYLNNKPATERQERKESENHNCITTTKYTASQRMQFYPFDTAAIIKVVSFTHVDSGMISSRLPLTGMVVDYTKIDEQKTLNKAQIDELTAILYNVTYKGKIFTTWSTGCYSPHNAILFCDENDNLLEFIEICFQCHASLLNSERIGLGDICNQKYDMLQSFFLKAGIEIGTTSR